MLKSPIDLTEVYMSNTNVLGLIETNRQLYAQLKQSMLANGDVANNSSNNTSTQLLATIATNHTTITNVLNATSQDSLYQGVQ